MAFSNLTVNFRQLSKIPVRDRAELARSPQASEIFGNMSPSQIAQLLPSYYRNLAVATGGSSMGAALSGGYSGGGGGGGSSSSSATAASSSSTPARPGYIQDLIGDAAAPALSTGDLNLKDRRSLLKGTYDAFRRAGFSDAQSRALVAEVGRENSFRPGIMFGNHAEPGRLHQGRMNVGIFSMAGARKDGLVKYMQSQGLLNSDGVSFVAGQASLDAMAKYAKMEMDGNPEAPLSPGQLKAAQRFLSDPTADQQSAGQNLAGWIAWDIAGRHHDAAESIRRRDSHRSEIDSVLSTLPGAEPVTGNAPQGTDFGIENLLGTPASPADASVKVVPAPSSDAKTMLLSLGTNDFTDPKNTYQNTLDAINEGRKKGYNVVVIPPTNNNEKFKAAYDEVMKAVNETGAPVEQPQAYSQDGYHPTGEEYKRIGEKYTNALVVGDSIAVGIGQHVDNGQTVATEGINTDRIVARVKSEEVTKLDTAQTVPQITNFDVTVFNQIDPRLKQYYDTAPDGEKRAIETAIMQKGVSSINQTMAKYPQASATIATNQTLEDAGYIVTDKLGNITSQPRKWDPSTDNPGGSIDGEFNYSLTSEAAQNFGIADASGRVSKELAEKNLTTIQTNGGVKVRVNKSIAKNATDFLNALEARGYPLRQQDTAGYVWKSKSKSNSLSTHATGTTLDLNWNSNWGTYGSANNIDFPPDVEKLANMHGFSWGAKFGDPMHFETMSPAAYQEKLKVLEEEGYIKRIESATDQVVVPQQGQAMPGAAPSSATAVTPTATQTTDTSVTPLASAPQAPTPTAAPAGEGNPPTAAVPPAETTPNMKLGGVANLVDEQMSVKGADGQGFNFNQNEEVNIKDGKATVKNEYQKKTEETKQKTDSGIPQKQNQSSMKSSSTTNDFLGQAKHMIVPSSPSAQRHFEASRFNDKHFRGNGARNGT